MIKKGKLKKLVSAATSFSIAFALVSSGVQVYAKPINNVKVVSSIAAQQSSKYKYGEVKQAINGACEVALENHYSSDWVAVGLSRAGKQYMIPSNYLNDVSNEIKQFAQKEDNGEFVKPTDYERRVLGILAAGGDPTNAAGINVIERIYNGDIDKQGINAEVFALIALDSKKYSVPANAKWNRQKLIKAILDKECSNGSKDDSKKAGWAFWGNNADPDMTGMAMTALAPYNNEKYPKVQAAINRAVNHLSKIQKNNGGFSSWGSVNSESCSQVIMGLCTNGISPTSKQFTKNRKNLIDALLSFKTSDGGFCHVKEYGGNTNGMATEQALYALDQYMYYCDELGSIYCWSK